MSNICSRLWLPLLGSFLLSGAAFPAEQILRFQSDIEVLQDGSMFVTETIRVRAEGEQIRRGIYRDFPTQYRDRWDNQIRVGFDVLEVRRDGSKESFFSEKRANGVRVYIGDANSYLDPGDYEYSIRYTTNRQLGYFSEQDELYWNVTGNGWAFPILRSAATVKLPAGIAATDVAVEAYTGHFGEQGRDYAADVPADSRAEISATRALAPNEGLTIVVSWPKGFVAEPDALDRAGYLLSDNRDLIFVAVGLAAMLVYLLYVWSRYGRDPQAGPIFPHYQPPQMLSPGACRYILKMGHDNQCFSAAVLSLAVKGYLTIHEGRTDALEAATGGSLFDKAIEKLTPTQKKIFGSLLELAEDALESAYDDTFVLEKHTDVAGLPKPGPGEKALLASLFPDGDYLVLVNSNHKIVSAGISAHKKALKKFYQRVYFLTNIGLLLPAALIGVISLLGALSAGVLSPFAIVGLVLMIPLLLGFAYLLKAPTALGRRTMDRLEGFEMYLTVAEAEDLQRIEGLAGKMPEQTPELFERWLPYAVALDVEQPWADQFEALFTRISAEEGRSYRSSWHNSSRPVRGFSNFTTSMTGALTTAISSASTAPGSSSGSSGGSSGGGGGGGGGGGW